MVKFSIELSDYQKKAPESLKCLNYQRLKQEINKIALSSVFNDIDFMNLAEDEVGSLTDSYVTQVSSFSHTLKSLISK